MEIIKGNCMEVLKTLEENSVDSVVTDPPYEIGFMGKSWDSSGIANNPEMWKECLRVLKPGGYLLSFSATRTYHRMAVGIEDAGFEIRDMIEWVYGSGFPKSLNIGKAVDKLQGNEREVTRVRTDGNKGGGANTYDDDNYVWDKPFTETKGTSEYEGWGTALKPAHEPICMARKPLAEKTVAENCLEWGTGGINIDESRVDLIGIEEHTTEGKSGLGNNVFGKYENNPKELTELPRYNTQGRFPANLIHDNSEEVRKCFPETKSGRLGIGHKQSLNKGGVLEKGSAKGENFINKEYGNDSGNASRFFKSIPQGRFPANLIHDNSEEVRECFPDTKSGGPAKTRTNIDKFWRDKRPIPNNPDTYNGGDSGNASRFFKSIIYQSKPSKAERNAGCEGLEEKETKVHIQQSEGRKNQGANKGFKVANNHPTVKPIALMEYLIKMVTPKGGVVLDPFMGSGTTGCAAVKNGFDFIGVDMEEEYIKIATARINHYKIEQQQKLF